MGAVPGSHLWILVAFAQAEQWGWRPAPPYIPPSQKASSSTGTKLIFSLRLTHSDVFHMFPCPLSTNFLISPLSSRASAISLLSGHLFSANV